MKYLKRALIVLAVLFLLIQIYRPAQTNPPIDETRTLQAVAQVPADVNAIFERSCNDCHSNKTRWPWYSKIAPVSWLVAYDVNEGRSELSFSDWGNYPAKKADHKLEEICEMVQKGEMPITPYLLIHGNAKLSEADKRILCNWANHERGRLMVQ